MSRKAYEVSDSLGDSGCRIVYAEKNVVARRNGAAELGCDFSDVSCRRATWADDLPGGPTLRQCIELGGWWCECACGCGRRIDSEEGSGNSAEDGDKNPMAPIYVGGQVFWNQACKDSDDQRRRERREAEARDQAQAEQETLEAFPFATEIKAYRGYGKGLDGKHSYDVLQAHFMFPGGKGVASWVLGSAKVSMRQEDVAAWSALVEAKAQ